MNSELPSTPPVIAVVIPCYREKTHILEVIDGLGAGVSHVVVVDDACPDGTGRFVEDHCHDPRVTVIRHQVNQGVGGATVSGYRRALELGADIVVKMDGDGQMDPGLIPAMVAPVVQGRADYAKGNRFHELEGVAHMPALRVIGNLALSFATKVSSGYWSVFDPTNGFTAIHAKVIRRLPLDKLSRGFFFESDILFRLNVARAVVIDVPMRARYGSETSSLRISRVVWEFPLKHLRNTAKRIVYAYFLRDFNIASIELVLGLLLGSFGVAYGAIRWAQSETTGIPATAGTVVLAALPVILASQMVLAFLDFDTRNVPREPLHPRL